MHPGLLGQSHRVRPRGSSATGGSRSGRRPRLGTARRQPATAQRGPAARRRHRARPPRGRAGTCRRPASATTSTTRPSPRRTGASSTSSTQRGSVCSATISVEPFDASASRTGTVRGPSVCTSNVSGEPSLPSSGPGGEPFRGPRSPRRVRRSPSSNTHSVTTALFVPACGYRTGRGAGRRIGRVADEPDLHVALVDVRGGELRGVG